MLTLYSIAISVSPGQTNIVPSINTQLTEFSQSINVNEETAQYMTITLSATNLSGTGPQATATRALKLRTPTNLRPNTSTTNPSPTNTLIVDWTAPIASTSFSSHTSLNLHEGYQIAYELRLVDSDNTEVATSTNLNLTHIFSQLNPRSYIYSLY